jgi:hypothetical protein
MVGTEIQTNERMPRTQHPQIPNISHMIQVLGLGTEESKIIELERISCYLPQRIQMQVGIWLIR